MYISLAAVIFDGVLRAGLVTGLVPLYGCLYTLNICAVKMND